MAFRIDRSADIDAPTDLVWRVITDFPRYSEWNTLISQCHSSLVPGEPIDMLVHVSGSGPRKQREWIRSHTPGREFSYAMQPLPLGALHSLRSHTVTPLPDNRTRYESHFELGGWLHPMVVALLGKNLRRGFSEMTEGIRKQAESLSTA
ncbi:SRPBCC family protein [Nocardia sp. 004]|uniref:SRPBCC family protein n=1 Tax=Nocardia sp. 004 TaxID=3385978 RepID=UPI00399F2D52